MKLYDNVFASGYEELKTFYPVFYLDVLEMNALLQAYGGQIDKIQKGVITAVDNCLVFTMDSATLRKFETFLSITYDGERTLSERRKTVNAYLTEKGHIGEREIRELVSMFTSGDIGVDFVDGAIIVTISREMSGYFNVSDCLALLKKRIPAHLGVVLNDSVTPIGFKEKENIYSLVELNLILGSFKPDSWRMNFEAFKIKLSGKRQKYNVGGILTADNMFTFDGSVLFDGSRKFNASITTETL